MTLASRIVSLFPAGFFLLLIALGGRLLVAPSWALFGLIALVIYFFPVLVFRCHNILAPMKYGFSDLAERRYSSWWGGHQIQIVYAVFPVFERLLRVIPGVYSVWLRLWGSTVGKGVYWTPMIEIHDRGSLKIGDHVIFGHKVECYAHVIKPKRQHLKLYTERISIGNNVFIGAGTRIGPGVEITDGTFVPLLTDLTVKKVVEDCE